MPITREQIQELFTNLSKINIVPVAHQFLNPSQLTAARDYELDYGCNPDQAVYKTLYSTMVDENIPEGKRQELFDQLSDFFSTQQSDI